MDDFDSPWKEALDSFFEAFLAFFFPHIHQAIDWTRGHEALDKELQQVMPDAELGRRYVDKLVKVCRTDGVEEWVLIHVEIQHSPDTEFPERMFVYHYRLRDRYHRKVASLAVLGDDRADWRTDRYHDEIWGCVIEFRFPIVKLMDWAPRWQELENDPNLFAVVVLADLKARETQSDPLTRKEWKFRIVRGLYERGVDLEIIRKLFRVIDWLMGLPEPLALTFDQELFAFEQEKVMPFITSVERHGIEKGKIEGKIEGAREAWLGSIELQLGHKFGPAGLALLPQIRQIEDPQKLKDLAKAILAATGADDLVPLL